MTREDLKISGQVDKNYVKIYNRRTDILDIETANSYYIEFSTANLCSSSTIRKRHPTPSGMNTIVNSNLKKWQIT